MYNQDKINLDHFSDESLSFLFGSLERNKQHLAKLKLKTGDEEGYKVGMEVIKMYEDALCLTEVEVRRKLREVR